MTTPASNNRFKGVTFQDQATPATPAAGDGRLFLDTADGLLKWIDDAGTVTEVALGSGSGLTDPMTTRGDIIVRNASNVTARLAKGAADTFLHSDGTDVGYAAVTDAMLSTSDVTTNNASTSKHGFAPKYPNDATKYLDGTGAYTVPAGSGGGLVKVETHTASASASLDFTTGLTSTYRNYLLVVSGLVPGTANAVPYLRCSTNGGSSYDTGNNYSWNNLHAAFGSNTWAGTNGNAVSRIELFSDGAGGGIATSGLPSLNGRWTLWDPLNATNRKMIYGDGQAVYNTGPAYYVFTGGGMYNSATAVNAFQIIMSSGTITSGVATLYGYAN